MNRRYEMVDCEGCGTPMKTDSPAPKEAYEQGRITLGECSSVLLDKREGSPYLASLTGFYCNIDCLIRAIKRARGTERAKKASRAK